MAKSSRQKLKILYIAKALQERTDEEHPMTVRDLIQYLQGFGILAERKAIYDDIDTLRAFGMEIESRRRQPSGFYLKERSFSAGELRLMADALHSAPFVSEEKTADLIHRLEGLAGVSERRKLTRHSTDRKTATALDERVYAYIDRIQDGMDKDRRIRFRYTEWTVEKKLVPRREGAFYEVSPWGIIRSEGCYYMIGIDEKSHIVKHYRIDRMQGISLAEEKRSGHALFQHFDAGEFAAKTFGMFGGQEETVTIRFENRFVGILIDRFGEAVRIVAADPEHFHAFLRVKVSRQFFGWLAGLGGGTEILSPESTRAEYRKFLKKAGEIYQ